MSAIHWCSLGASGKILEDVFRRSDVNKVAGQNFFWNKNSFYSSAPRLFICMSGKVQRPKLSPQERHNEGTNAQVKTVFKSYKQYLKKKKKNREKGDILCMKFPTASRFAN